MVILNAQCVNVNLTRKNSNPYSNSKIRIRFRVRIREPKNVVKLLLAVTVQEIGPFQSFKSFGLF